jgi:hypothetical protein
MRARDLRLALPGRAICGDEEPAVGALEAAVAFGLAGDQFCRERLLTVRTDDFVRHVLCGQLRHTVHRTWVASLWEESAVALERRALGRRRLATRSAEMDEPEEALFVGQADGITSRLGAKHERRSPVSREAARMSRQ